MLKHTDHLSVYKSEQKHRAWMVCRCKQTSRLCKREFFVFELFCTEPCAERITTEKTAEKDIGSRLGKSEKSMNQRIKWSNQKTFRSEDRNHSCADHKRGKRRKHDVKPEQKSGSGALNGECRKGKKQTENENGEAGQHPIPSFYVLSTDIC